jgi:hypothetical protein
MEAGDKQIAVRLLESVFYELKLRQRFATDFRLGRTSPPQE